MMTLDGSMMEKNEMLRSLIRMADSFDDADRIIMSFTPWRTSEQKLAFLSGLFEYSILSHDTDDTTDGDKYNFDYIAVLNTIVKAKWR